jgi:hypothetical protein
MFYIIRECTIFKHAYLILFKWDVFIYFYTRHFFHTVSNLVYQTRSTYILYIVFMFKRKTYGVHQANVDLSTLKLIIRIR